MNYNRRDHKNRRLKEGESQRADKRYRFTYVDLEGNKRDVYSWRLDKNDPHPEGKRKDLSLREKEKQIERDRYDQILSNGGNYTVLALVSKYVSLRKSFCANDRRCC